MARAAPWPEGAVMSEQVITMTRRSAPPIVAAPPRVWQLDVLRGFALCGILLVNIPPLVQLAPIGSDAVHPVRVALDVWVQNRFFPIFSVLFGVSFAMLLEGAAARTRNPRVVVLHRLVALGLIGAVHQLLQPGEALLFYAVVGLVVLLPASWLPRALVLAGAVVALALPLATVGAGLPLLPGLFLLGLAISRFHLPETLEVRGRQLAVLFGLAGVATVPALAWQGATLSDRADATAGLVMATAYVTGLLLLLGTPARRPLQAALEPLGRMALTNYVTATLLVLAADPLLGLGGSDRWGAAIVLAVAILALQVAWSRWWLAHHRYGPLEWVLRCATWTEVVPNRRTAG